MTPFPSTLALYLHPPILNNDTTEQEKLVFQNFYHSKIVGPTVGRMEIIDNYIIV